MISILFAVLAACSNAFGTVLQRRAVLTVPASKSLRLGLMKDLLRTPVWLAGILGVILAAIFQALALGTGSLAAVQPVFILELPLALVIGGMVFHVELSHKAWACVACIAGGLALFLFSMAPSGARAGSGHLVGADPADRRRARRGAGARRAAAAQRPDARRLPGRGGRGGQRPHGRADQVVHGHPGAPGRRGLAAVLADLRVRRGRRVLAVPAGDRHAGGPLIASQPALTLGDAVVGFCLGVTLYGEQPRTGFWLLPALVGFAVLSYGVFAMSRTQCLYKCVHPEEHLASPAGEPAASTM